MGSCVLGAEDELWRAEAELSKIEMLWRPGAGVNSPCCMMEFGAPYVDSIMVTGQLYGS